MTELRHRSERSLGERARRVRATAIVAAQSGIAAGVSWFIANDLIRIDDSLFAPIAAVITLDISVGQRYRRAVELVIGVTLGVALADSLIYVIGTGGWQIGVTVALATVFAVFLGGSSAVVAQAASSAVLVGALVPPRADGIYYERVIAAFIGGLVALVVMAVLLPANPLSIVSRKARPTLGVLVDGLTETARALSGRDAALADAALSRLNGAEPLLDEFRATVPEGREIAAVSPLRWRARGALTQYIETAEHLERVFGNARVLVRRAVPLIHDGEPVPERLTAAVGTLAAAIAEMRRELGRGASLQRTAERSTQAVQEAAEAYRAGLGFSGGVIVAQIRAIATDLLGACGLPYQEANRVVRRAGGKLDRP